MSASATQSIWQVTVAEGSWSSLREGTWLFTSERAAKAFIKVAEKAIPEMYRDIDILELDAYKTSSAALFQGWPFDELKAAAEARQ